MQQPQVFIITGKQGEGKTTLLKESAGLLKERGLSVFGFYAKGEWEQGLRSRFWLTDIQSNRQHLLCSRQKHTPSSRGKFVFYDEAVQAGEAVIFSGIHTENSLAILDEIGPFELEGKVWHKIFQWLLKKRIPVIITVRDNLLEAIIQHYHITRKQIFRVHEHAPDEVARSVYQALRNKHTKKGG